MRHIIELTVDEFNSGLIDKIKALISESASKRVTIVVEDELDETEYLLQSTANHERLTQSLKNARNGNFISPDLDAYRQSSAHA